MQVTLYSNFSKRRNSTKQPTTGGVVKDVKLKGECSYTRPSFFLADATKYTYLQAWGNYYFIDERLYDINGASYVNCSIDVRASFKTEILATSAFVEYSSSNYSENLIDNRISQLVTMTRDRTVQSSMFVKNFNEGCYILTTANVRHGVCSYIVNSTTLEEIINDLIEVSPTEISNWQELFGDAMGSIISVRYVPIPYSHFSQSTMDVVVLGGFNTGYSGILHKGNIGENRTFDIPWRYSDFRRCSEFTRFAVALPFIGIVEIKPESLIGYDNLTVQMVGNCITGNISYNLVVGSPDVNKIIATYTGVFGMQIPVAQGQVDLNGILSSGVTAGGAWLATALTKSGNPMAQAVGIGVMGASIIKAIVSANMQDFTIVGGYSGGYGEVMIQNYEMYSFTNDTRTEPSSLTDLYGRPCMQVHTMSELTGYVQTNGFRVDMNETDEIKRMINEAMDSGTYLE